MAMAMAMATAIVIIIPTTMATAMGIQKIRRKTERQRRKVFLINYVPNRFVYGI